MVAPAPPPSRLPWLLVVILLTAPLAGCDKVALTAPTQSTISLFASLTVVPVNGTAEITATVIEQAGTPVQNGTLVTFSTTLGSIDPREARTNNGKVTVRFSANQTSGTATIRAFSGSAQSDPIDLKVGGAAAAKVVLSVSPGSLPVGGGTVTLTATVTDENGNRLAGIPVTFTSTTGSLLNGTVLTDGNGEARTTLTSNRQAQVTASAGSQQAQITVDVNSQYNLTISAPQAPTVGGIALFQVTVVAGANSAPLREVTLDFGDGDRVSLGTPSGQINVTHVYRSAGTFTVTATATDTSGSQSIVTTQVTVLQPGRPLVALTLTPTSVPVNGIVQATVQISQNPNNIAIASVEFNFGDGNVKVLNSTQTTHAYSQAGSYNVRATVRFVDGQQSSTEAGIRVTP